MERRMKERLEYIFSPRSIAVIGASRSRRKVGWEVLHNILTYGYQGRVYPVNLSADSIHSIKAYPSVLDIPDEVDMAIILIPASKVLQVVEECGQKGVKGLVVITAGFSEIGPSGAELENELTSLVRRYGMVMVGPNCMGVINTHPDVQMDATFAPIPPLRGNIAFMTQSGALGVAILEHSRNVGVGLSKFVSLGNAADVNGNELIEYWEKDPETHIILLYIESFGDPRSFVKIARRVTKSKPIIALKSGRTEAGARATVSHTGAMAGPDVGTQALFEQCGVLRVGSIQELFDLAMAFSLQPLPRGRRAAVITNGGGPGIMATDALASVGMELAEFSPETTAYLRKNLPEEASANNPVDLISDADAARYKMAMEAVLRDENVDALLVITVPPVIEDEVAIARAIRECAQKYDKTVMSCFLARTKESPAFMELVTHGIPSYLFPENAARALAAMCTYREYLEREEGEFRVFDVDRKKAEDIIRGARSEGRTRLLEMEALDLLKAYGFRIVRTRLVKDEEEAVRAAEEIGYPVVLKAVHPEIVHKTDYGAVVLDIRNRDELLGHLKDLGKRLSSKGIEDCGFMVQEYARGGKETIMGMKLDQKFGPMILFGLGGIYVEVLKDVVFRLTPMTDMDALRMIRSVRSYPILEGVRGEPPSDVEALVEYLQRLSQLVEDFHDIAEVDINPFLAFEKGKGCKVVDARILLTEAPGTSLT
jgi:acetyltransferase